MATRSLGTGLSVPSVLAEHSAWVVRYALGSVQYRSMLEWSDQTLAEAQSAYDRVANFIERAGAAVGKQPSREEIMAISADALPADFVAAMNDDINVSGASAAIFTAIRSGNTLLSKLADRADSDVAKAEVREALVNVRAMLDTLGLDPLAEPWVSDGAAGGAADCIMNTIIIDEKSREIRLKEIIKELDRQCQVVGVGIAGGHTTVCPNVNSPVVSVTAIGHKLRTHQKAVAGQDIVMTKHIGMSGIRTVISHKRDEILNVLPEDVINKAFAADEELIIAKEAQIFIKQNIDGAMHDASEGGIFAALWDMAEYSGTGLDIDLRHISVKQEIIEICELFNINPYILDSMGCLLMTCENGCDIVNIMKQNGIEAAVIGKITDGNNRIIHNTEEDRYLGLPEQDEIYRFI